MKSEHLDRVDRMELIESQMWINYWKEEDRYKKVKILAEIVNIQPYISSYYEATKDLLENREASYNIKRKCENNGNEVESSSWADVDKIPPVGLIIFYNTPT